MAQQESITSSGEPGNKNVFEGMRSHLSKSSASHPVRPLVPYKISIMVGFERHSKDYSSFSKHNEGWLTQIANEETP